MKFIELLVFELKDTLQSLDQLSRNLELPTIDIDAVLSICFDAVKKENLTGKQLDDYAAWIVTTCGMDAPWYAQQERDYVLGIFLACLIDIREKIKMVNLYTNGYMPYRYKQRRGDRSVLLEQISPTSVSI